MPITDRKKEHFSTVDSEDEEENTLLNLPELALECILGRLSPEGLQNVAGVCAYLRDRCRSDHLWEKHMKQKWGRVVGPSFYQKWKTHIATKKKQSRSNLSKNNFTYGYLCSIWPISLVMSKFECSITKPRNSLPVDSVMAFYLSLENGKFWFPAQVHNRENGHAGFLLSCYDAEVRYDSHTDTFVARFSPNGGLSTEENIQWDRIRPPPIDTPAYEPHVSDCLNDLRPGDHIEIQWRRNKEFPYGWWYGIVGHLETCFEKENHCYCHFSDNVNLEFNHYSPNSRWRRKMINRKTHQEEGNGRDGFYGGIRKLNEDEISMWKRFWPSQFLEQ